MVNSKFTFKLSQAIAAFSAGNKFADLTSEWSNLRYSYQFAIVAIPTIVALLALALITSSIMNYPGSSILVYARSEYVEYVPLRSDPPQWVFPPSTLVMSETREQINLKNGAIFQPACGDTIIISRVGRGKLKVHVQLAEFGSASVREEQKIEDKELGDYFEDVYIEPTRGFHSAISFEMLDIRKKPIPTGEKSEEGVDKSSSENTHSLVGGGNTSTNWPMAGLISPGRRIKFETNETRGLLLSGTIQVLTKYILSNNHYEERNLKLNIGDQIVLQSTEQEHAGIEAAQEKGLPYKVSEETCASAEPADKGFVNIDEKPGMNVVLFSESDSGKIVRYNTTPITVGSSWVQRIAQDKWFAIAWGLILAFFSTYRRIVRAILANERFKNEA